MSRSQLPDATWSRLVQELAVGATLLITLRTSHARARLQRLARAGVVGGLVLTLIGLISQIAVGSCFLMSSIKAGVISVGNVISTLPATKARTAVARLAMIVYSMPSR